MSGKAPEDAAREVEALVARYIDCFNADDFEGAMTCYRLPFTWYFGPKSVTVSTPGEFLETMRKTKAALVKDGLSRSKLLGMTVRSLGRFAALAGVEVTRVLTDGSEMQRTAGTYFVHDDGTGWRLAINWTHSLDAIIPATGA